MCGIAGSLNLTGAPIDVALLHRMIGAIRHRGPDDTGCYTDHHLGLGHARLSIVDLAGGHQPMLTADGTLAVIFNGEIFNYVELRNDLIRKGHTFTTTSDTEVILQMYREFGERCVDHFNGQWAFAIWDARPRKLFLSRDRLGVRPLFYTHTDKCFHFASEVKALLACPDVPCELDCQALDQIFTFWATLPPRTAFRNIHQLPPGHSLVVEDGRLRIERHWQLTFPPDGEHDDGRVEQLAEEMLALLRDATRIRLRADVPVGAYLSGGLDSTLITALCKDLVGERLRTFSVSFEDPEFDESSYQQEASAFLHTEHTDVRCSASHIAQAFPDVVRHAEQPILRTAPAPLFLLSKLVRDSRFKVVLTGEGADEMMGGYDIFKEAKVRRFWARRPASRLRPLLLKRLYPYMEGIQRQPTAYLQHFFHATSEDLASPFFSHLPRWALATKLKRFVSDDVRARTPADAALSELERALPKEYSGWHPFHQAQYLEATGLLPGYILSSQGDRMAMAHSVEGRYPFLDHRVVAFASRLSPHLKMKVLDEKHLLKRAASGLVPPSIERRPKQPYRAPDGKCFFNSGGGYVEEYVEEMLSTDIVRRHGVFDPLAVAALVRKFKSNRPTGAADNMAMVGILSTQLLLEQFRGVSSMASA